MPHPTTNLNSEKKKSTFSLEQALIASEIRYRRLFESTKEGILILDAKTGMIVDVNPFLIGLLGYSKESFIEKSIWEIGLFKDIINNLDKFLELKRDKYIRYEDLPLETAGGRKINVEFVSNVYLVNNQKIIQCNIRDITERKKKEASQEKIRKKLVEIKTIADEESNLTENIINTIREPLLVLDEELRAIKASSSFYNFFKVNPENTIGRLIYELGNHQWDIPKLRELLEKILPEKTSFDNYEVEHNFSSIGRRIMLLNARQIKRGLGKEKIILLAFEDITERRREERSLSEKSRLNIEYLNILLNHAHAPIIIWDSSLLIKRFNPEFEKLSGYTKSEVQNKEIAMLFPKNEIDSTLEIIKSNIGNETTEVIEINILTKDKEIRTVLWNSANIFDEDGNNTVATIVQDITSRKRSEEALINSEIRFRRLFESAKDGILILNAETGMIVDVNLFLIKLLGYSKEEFTQKTLWEIGFFNDIIQNEEKFLKLQQEEYIRYVDLPMETADGRKIHVEFVSNVYIEGSQKVIQCNIRDITERKQAEETLRKSEAKLDEAMKIAKLGIWEYDVAQDHFKFNDQFYTLLHTTAEQEGGYIMSPMHYAQKFLHPDDLALVAMETQKALETTDPNYFSRLDHRIIYANGEIGYISVNIRIEKDSRGHTIKTYGVNQDITERNNAEKEILMLAQALKSIKECVSITDLEDKIIFVNESFLKTYGYLENEIIGENINIVRSQNNTAKLNKKILPATLKGGWKGELWNKRKDGSEFPIYLSTSIINDKNGIPLGLIGVASDITENKRFELELIRAKEKAEESNRLKSAFLTNMSHEIRTPMNGILGFAGLLKERGLTGEKQQEYIKIIEKSSARMLNIITAIVSISKIESGQMETIISETNVNEHIDFVYNFFKPEVEQKGIQIIAKKALPSKEAVIKSDREKIYAILTNLVGNAAKFTHTGSIELGYEKKGKYLEFFVKDTGNGIADENKEIFFTRFRQGSESLTRNYEGAGLGLSISKAYVEMLGGKIWVESELGKGSIFYFTIPYNTETETETNPEEPVLAGDNESMNKNLKIMIAEDD